MSGNGNFWKAGCGKQRVQLGEEKFISIVEDDDSLREALIGLLRSTGHKARGFPDAETFLAVRDGQCGCVITDIKLPGLSGIEMTERIRAMGYAVPVIMITARADAGLEDQAQAAGAICMLKKPFETEALLDCVNRALAA
jgi:FixJ family two-component response regulator